MDKTLFHVFRNTPFGRETFLQSLYFCKRTGTSIAVYIPESTKFLMYFENDVVQVDLDGSYIEDPATAREHVESLAQTAKIEPRFLKPKNYTASTLPDIPVNFDFMCCPRSISNLSSKISLGSIGPKVRRIVHQARFPVLMPCPLFKEWKSITVFFGGSSNAVNALRLGINVGRKSGLPVDMFTHSEGGKKEKLEDVLIEKGLYETLKQEVRQWHYYEKGKFEHNLYDVEHNALGVIGAFGHGMVKDMLFGSTMEKVQTVLPNNLLIVGPNYVMPSN
ncbi:MAG: universal stress protein [Desulfobacteraceae bacterium]